MRLLIQRVTQASVSVDGLVVGQIGAGLACLVGIRHGDTTAEVQWLVDKACQLRIFPDAADKMNLSVEDTDGGVLVVSQFTLYGDARKGNRPNFTQAAAPHLARELYEYMVTQFRARLGSDRVASGLFQAMMDVQLVNHGPVTILLEKESSQNFSAT